MTDLNLLKTIAMYYPHPYRLLYMRCWGCGKRRVGGEWWEGYQSANGLKCEEAAALAHWGYFCSSCIVIVASMISDRLRFCRSQAELDTVNAVLDLFDCEEADSGARMNDRIEKMRDRIVADQQHDGL